MKKRIAALVVAFAVAALCGCAANAPAASKKETPPPATPSKNSTAVSHQIAPASLTDKEAEIAALLAPGVQYQIFEFKFTEPVKTVRFNRYRLENGVWAPEGGSGQTLKAASGRIALVADNNAKKNRLALQSEGGGSAISYDLPEDIGDAGVASGISYLNETAEIVLDVEIPLQTQIFTTQNSFSTYDAAAAFEQPALYAQDEHAHVYAVTVTFSQRELGQGDDAGQEGTFSAGEVVNPSPPAAGTDLTPGSEAQAVTRPMPGTGLADQSTNDAQAIYAPLYPSFSPHVKTISFDVINGTDNDLGAGDHFRLQRLDDGAWIDLPRLPLPENAGPLSPSISGPFWPPHTRTRLAATVDTIDGSEYPLYSLPLKTGTHRLIDEYKNVSTPFEITDAPSEWQKRTIERLSQIPAFAGVTFSPHDFTLPFVCQGIMSDSDISGIKLYVFDFPDWKEAQAVFEGIRQDDYAIPQYTRQNDAIIRDIRKFNWEDTPHFYYVNNEEIYLYCGDDAAILSVLPDAVAVVNYS